MNNSPRIFNPQDAPYSEEAEEAVIGAVLINPDSYLSVASFLKHDDFYFLRHQYIWQALQRLSERDEPVDYLTLSQELRDMSWLDEIGGLPYLTRLINNTPTSIHAEFYGRIVERAALRRRLLVAADEIKALAMNEQMDIENVIVESERRMFNVTERQLKREFIPLRDAVSEYFDQIEHLMQNPHVTLGVPTGFRDLDELLGGFQKSDLLIFAGRPGSGKTSFMLSTAVNSARLGARVAIFTMEMGADQLVQRMISMETGINSHQLRLGRLSQQEYTRFVEAAGRISRFQIFIDDTPALNPLQMRTKCRRLQHEHGLDLVMVDYLQLMNAGGTYENNRVQEVSFISRAVKELARELNVPIFSAAQLSRAVEQRQDKRPLLSDLRESGCLSGDTLIHLPDEGRYVPIRELSGQSGFRVTSLNMDTWQLEAATVSAAFCTGTKPVYRLKTKLGRTIRATANHKFLTIDGWKRLDELLFDDQLALPVPETVNVELNAMIGRGAACCAPAPTLELMLASGRAVARPYPAVHPVGTPNGASDITWDGIVSIEPDGETDVYDLTVPGNSNFVANNIIVHNSLEQDADIVMFLYRDVIYNEATEFPNQAEVIVAKHRNGSTGTISLYFDNALTKFMDGTVRRVDLGDV